MDPKSAEEMLPVALNVLLGTSEISELSEQQMAEHHLAQVFANNQLQKPGWYGFRDMDIAPGSIAVIPFHDVIFKHDQWCGPTGMHTKAKWIQEADAHPNIIAIVGDFESGGGQGSAMWYIMDVLNSIETPTIANIGDGMAGSAAYGIASAFDERYCTYDDDIVGSIGTYMEVPNWRKHYKDKHKLDIHVIYATKSTRKNEEYEALMKGNKKPILKNIIDPHLKTFVSSVRENLGDRLQNDEVFEGAMYRAQDALAIGLIDGILTQNEIYDRARELGEAHQERKKNGNSNSNTNNMFNKKKNNSATLMAKFATTKAEERSQEQLDELNAALDAEDSGFFVVQATDEAPNAQALQDGITDLEDKVEDLGKTNSTLKDEKAALEKSNKDLTDEVSGLKAKLAGKPAEEGGADTTEKKDGDKIPDVSDEEKSIQDKIDALNPTPA